MKQFGSLIIDGVAAVRPVEGDALYAVLESYQQLVAHQRVLVGAGLIG
jgi:hypothetical protein